MNRISSAVLATPLLLLMASTTWASTETALAAAATAGHPVFLVVTEPAASGVDLARRVASDAQKIAADASIIELDRADRANEAVVKKYRLESVPVPLILVIASNGVAAGGARPDAVSAERLAAMIPSPAKAAMLRSIDDKKATFLVFWRASMPTRAAALQAADDAVAALKQGASVVSIDLDSEKEARFVADMQVDARSTVPIVGVYNAKGQPTETFLGVPKVDVLVAAATKEVHECCPGGRCK